ncbi:MAG: cell division protein SepF [Clostridia bacterium]|jgi:cell division inhibitor SepF|nr:cell division protein SepF [Clostridia bacterium]
MGFLDKLKFGKNFDDEDDYEKETEKEEFDDEEVIEPASKPAEAPAPQKQQRATGNVKLDGAALELKVVKPERYDTVPQIADHLLNRRTVVLNLEATNKETARRMIDFLSGVAYAIDGRLSKVAVNTYIITPANISVSGEALVNEKQENSAEDEEKLYSED